MFGQYSTKKRKGLLSYIGTNLGSMSSLGFALHCTIKPYMNSTLSSNYKVKQFCNLPFQNWGSDLLCSEQAPSSRVPTSGEKELVS